MEHEIFDTFSIWDDVHSDEYKKELAENHEMDIEDIDDEWLYDDERMYLAGEIDCLKYELDSFIERYEKRYKTLISNIVFIGHRSSHYGWVGGAGRVVGVEVGSSDFSDISLPYDRIAFRITDDYKLELVTADHDGTNYMEMVLVTQNEQNTADEQYEDIRVIIDEKSKNSTKLDNDFMTACGFTKEKRQKETQVN